MQFASIRIITEDHDRLVSFYERVTGVTGRASGATVRLPGQPGSGCPLTTAEP
jgi:hypothetical protein